MSIPCQEFILWIGEGDREEREKEREGYKMGIRI
jgi:hypothetical protein